MMNALQHLNTNYGEMTFARALKSNRKCSGLTQAAFAKRLEVPVSLVQAWERSKKAPSVDQAKKIAAFFGLNSSEYIRYALASQKTTKASDSSHVLVAARVAKS